MTSKTSAVEVSIDSFFNPMSVAILGASSGTDKPAGRVLETLIQNGFGGKIFPINPKYEELLGLKCYRSISDINEEVDLVLVAVPTVAAVEQCAKKGVKAVVLITAGFAETGREGAMIQDEIVRIARRSGMRICGPNSLGVLSSPVRLDATFAMVNLPRPDEIAFPELIGFVSQSGGFGIVVYEMIRGFGIGFSRFVSSGNEADIDFSEYVAWLAKDTHTRIIGGYLEGIKDGVALIRSAEMALAAGKPLVIMKVGRQTSGAKAVASHTGALAGSDRVYDAVFRQKGIVRVDSLHEMLAVLTILAGGKPFGGNRVAVVAASGGIGVLVADQCVESGLKIAQFSNETSEQLSSVLPPFASINNPVDTTPAFMANKSPFVECCRIVAADPNVDTVLVCYHAQKEMIEPKSTKATDTESLLKLEDIVALSQDTEKPVVSLVMGNQDIAQPVAQYLIERRSSAICVMENGIKAVGLLMRYDAKRRSFFDQRIGVLRRASETNESVARIISQYPRATKLTEYESKRLLSAWGIPVTREELVTSSEAAVDAAQRIGYPVALKVQSVDVLTRPRLAV